METNERKANERERKRQRRNAEGEEEASERKKKERERKRRSRIAERYAVEEAITAFLNKVKTGPEYVCTCCHRLMYRKTVTVSDMSKYTRAMSDALNTVFANQYWYVSIDNKLWICCTCDSS